MSYDERLVSGEKDRASPISFDAWDDDDCCGEDFRCRVIPDNSRSDASIIISLVIIAGILATGFAILFAVCRRIIRLCK